MEKWIIKPAKSVGKIYFGMRRTEIRNMFGDYKEFKKSKYSQNTTDDFGMFHVFYSKDNQCEAVEIFGDIQLKLDTKIAFPGIYSDITSILMSNDDNIEIEKDGFISKKLSIGIYATDDRVESILIGEEGYYE